MAGDCFEKEYQQLIKVYKYKSVMGFAALVPGEAGIVFSLCQSKS